VGVEFGPPTGLSLFPQGGLQTAFLAANVASAIASVSYLGVTTAFAGDGSPKLIYVSPRFSGIQLGVSGSWDAEPTPFGADFKQSAQVGLVYEHYFGQNVWRIGGSYGLGYRRVSDGMADQSRSLHSANLGTARPR
jgi:hypothetical protein